MIVWTNAQAMGDWIAKADGPLSCLYCGHNWGQHRRVEGHPEYSVTIAASFSFIQ